MKKVIIYIISIVTILFSTDYLMGVFSSYYIKNHKLPGRYRPLDKLIKEVNTDIILIGNSAILNSIDPKIVEDSLSMTCYNGGIEGQGIEFCETVIGCILQRHTPNIIVLGLRPEEIGGNIGEGIYDVLKPYYKIGYKSIDDHFNQAGKFERTLIQSNLLRYNTIWVRVLLYMLFDNTIYQDNGFMPKDIPSSFPSLKHIDKVEQPISNKLDCIERIIKKCNEKKIKLLVCYPPVLMSFDNKTVPCINAVNDLCVRYNIPCFINYDNKYFQQRPELFYDNGHVNSNGASVYSKLFSSELLSLREHYDRNK